MKVHPTPADQAMERLRAGNARFASELLFDCDLGDLFAVAFAGD